jgi:hypothetical protein
MCHTQQFSWSEDIPAHCVSLVNTLVPPSHTAEQTPNVFIVNRKVPDNPQRKSIHCLCVWRLALNPGLLRRFFRSHGTQAFHADFFAARFFLQPWLWKNLRGRPGFEARWQYLNVAVFNVSLVPNSIQLEDWWCHHLQYCCTVRTNTGCLYVESLINVFIADNSILKVPPIQVY